MTADTRALLILTCVCFGLISLVHFSARPAYRYLVTVNGMYLRLKIEPSPRGNGWQMITPVVCDREDALAHRSERKARAFIRQYRLTSSLRDLALDWQVQRVKL